LISALAAGQKFTCLFDFSCRALIPPADLGISNFIALPGKAIFAQENFRIV
jgi:hypothetical protein